MCKAGFMDSMAGAASMMLKANGLENVQPLRQKVVEMIALSEGIHAVAVGGALMGYELKGSWQPSREVANSVKIFGVEVFMKAMANLIDIAGGIPATALSEFDLESSVGP